MPSFGIEADLARMRRRQNKFLQGRMKVLTAATVMTNAEMDRGVKIAQEEIQRNVYDVYEPTYYQRTEALLNAVRKRRTALGIASGNIYMSRGALFEKARKNFQGEMWDYILAVQKGHGGIVTFPGRDFWHPTLQRIKDEARVLAGVAGKAVGEGLMEK